MPEVSDKEMARFREWEASQRTNETESDTPDGGGDAATFVADTSERDKGRTDLPWSAQTEDVPQTGAEPAPGSSLVDTVASEVTGGESMLSDVHRMVSDLHRIIAPLEPTLAGAKEELDNKGIGGIFRSLFTGK